MEALAVHPAGAPPVAARKRPLWIVATALVVGLLIAYWLYGRFTTRANYSLDGAKFFTVAPIEMQVKVEKDGELQSVNNIDVSCQVDGGSTIVQIVKEGSSVKKGDVLVVLDSSTIKQKMEDMQVLLESSKADATTAKEMLDIQEGQNAANLEAAQVDMELAKLAILQYSEGTYPQDLHNAEVTAKMARITVANKEDDLRQMRELYSKNFVTFADVKTAELGLETVKNDLAKAEGALDVLQKYTHQMDLAAKNSYVAQSQQKLARVQKENASQIAQKRADYNAKNEKLALLQRQFNRLQEQAENCTIKAPADGLVVYYQSNRESAPPIQEGTQVRERQVLLRLPDTSAMKSIVKINESQVARLQLGQKAVVKITGINEPVGAVLTKISPVADSSQKYYNPDLREYPVELTLDWTPPSLKPGIGAQTSIQIDSIPEALAVPLGALYAQGVDSFVFLHEGDQVKPTRVAVGQSNETHAQVTTGLTNGQQVLLLAPGQGRELLEKANIQLTPPEQPKKHTGKTGGSSGKRSKGGGSSETRSDTPATGAEKPAAQVDPKL